MTDSGSQATLNPIWEQHRNRILTDGHALHALLPEGDPPITLHGRDLRPADEGVGFPFQYTLTGGLYNGRIAAACFVVQIELVEGTTAISVKINAAPLLEYRDGHYELFDRRGTSVPIGDTLTMRLFFAESLTPSATRFSRVRAGEPMDEIIAGFAGPAPTT